MRETHAQRDCMSRGRSRALTLMVPGLAERDSVGPDGEIFFDFFGQSIIGELWAVDRELGNDFCRCYLSDLWCVVSRLFLRPHHQRGGLLSEDCAASFICGRGRFHCITGS